MYAALKDFDTTPQIEAHINDLARRAKLDPCARNQLYSELEFKIARFVRRARYRAEGSAVCDADDISQEAFVVFCDLVERWPGKLSFLGFFLTRFPWRLARAIVVIMRGTSSHGPESLLAVPEFEPIQAASDNVLLAEIEAGLSPRDQMLLELRIIDRMSLAEISRRLGCHPRTVQRRWSRILAHLRAGYEPRPRPE